MGDGSTDDSVAIANAGDGSETALGGELIVPAWNVQERRHFHQSGEWRRLARH